MKVLFVGDIHGEFSKFNRLINKKHADIVIQCGDNAYYWACNKMIGRISPQISKIYLVPGNHEDWFLFENEIGRVGLSPVEVEKNIFCCPIGSSIEVNGKKIIFIGGADSVDKMYRTLGVTWFRQEVLTQSDVNFIFDNHSHADIVVSHTCPHDFNLPKYHYKIGLPDPTRDALSALLTHLKPAEWFFGHWHAFIQGKYLPGNCRYWGLNHIESGDRHFIMREI